MIQNKIKIAFISNGFGLSPVMSGGEIRLFNLLKRLPSNFEAVLYTTEGGIIAAKNYPGLAKLRLRLIKSSYLFKTEAIGFQRLLGYIVSAFNCAKVLSSESFDMVYTSSDFFCDTLPAYFAAKKTKCKWIAMTHHKYNSPMKRPGNFINNVILYLIQAFSFSLIAKRASALLTLETEAGDEIKATLLARGFKGHCFSVRNGVEIIKKTTFKKNKKLAVYIGGLRPSKGLYDIAPIWQKVSAAGAYQLVVIGKGSASDMEFLRKDILKNGLEKAVTIVGYAEHSKLKKYLSEAFLFFLPSHEEGWGISVIEALMYGNKVVVYDLPAFKVFGKWVKRIKCFNKEEYAKAVISAFKLSKPQKVPMTFINKYNWDTIAKTEFTTLEKIHTP
ncbi:MAG: glycosyltransferase [bacterium]